MGGRIDRLMERAREAGVYGDGVYIAVYAPDTGLWELDGILYASEQEAINSLHGDYEIIIINDAAKAAKEAAEKREVGSIVKTSVKTENPGRSKKDSFQGDQHVSQRRNGHKGGKYHNKRV